MREIRPSGSEGGGGALRAIPTPIKCFAESRVPKKEGEVYVDLGSYVHFHIFPSSG